MTAEAPIRRTLRVMVVHGSASVRPLHYPTKSAVDARRVVLPDLATAEPRAGRSDRGAHGQTVVPDAKPGTAAEAHSMAKPKLPHGQPSAPRRAEALPRPPSALTASRSASAASRSAPAASRSARTASRSAPRPAKPIGRSSAA